MTKQILILIIFAFSVVSQAAAQAGGNFVITQSVIASGGGQNSSGGNFSLAGTIGQAVAGEPAGGSTFRLYTGFFAPVLNPTAAGVTVGGRVTTASGAGIRNVAVTLTDASGAARTTASGAGGYYIFADVPAGATYIISVAAKRYRFAENTQILAVAEDVTDINFVADSDRIIPLLPILNSPLN